MQFAIINAVPAGFCRKMYLLAPSGRLDALAQLSRDDLPNAGLSPTNMEAIEGFREWQRLGITPALGLLMWYLETVQQPNGGFLRTEDARNESVGVAVRYLQIAGQLGVKRSECPSVDRAARWLSDQITSDGTIVIPISGVVDYGMLARAIKSLALVAADDEDERLERATFALAEAQVGPSIWPTYPNGPPSTGATSLAISTVALLPDHFAFHPDASWLLSLRNSDGGWGEHQHSPSKTDNTFWVTRACQLAGEPIDPATISSHITSTKGRTIYDLAMVNRLRAVLGETASHDLTDSAMTSLTDTADRYAETSLLGLALCEQSSAETADAATLPRITPEFLRREPPLYDQLAGPHGGPVRTKVIDIAASSRLVETTVGWLVGIWAAVALLSEEVIVGVADLSPAANTGLLILEALLLTSWISVQPSRKQAGLRLTISFLVGYSLLHIVAKPLNIPIPHVATAVLVGLLGMIIDIITVATDKADLLNRLRDD